MHMYYFTRSDAYQTTFVFKLKEKTQTYFLIMINDMYNIITLCIQLIH